MGKLVRYELMTASCSDLTLTVTQGWGVDGSVGAREWEWDDDVERERERDSREEIPCSLTPTPFSLAVFWLWYLTLQQWDPSKQRVMPRFPHRRKIFSFWLLIQLLCLSSLWGQQGKTTSIPPSKAFLFIYLFLIWTLKVKIISAPIELIITFFSSAHAGCLTCCCCYFTGIPRVFLVDWRSICDVDPSSFLLFSSLWGNSCGQKLISPPLLSSHATMFARIFIPKKHRQRFDEAVSQNVINRLCRSKSISEPQGRTRRSRSEDHSDRHRGSKRASSVPRDGEPGGRGEAERDRGLRKSVSGIPVHPPIGPNQRWAHMYATPNLLFFCNDTLLMRVFGSVLTVVYYWKPGYQEGTFEHIM